MAFWVWPGLQFAPEPSWFPPLRPGWAGLYLRKPSSIWKNSDNEFVARIKLTLPVNFTPRRATSVSGIPRGQQCNPSVVNIREGLANLRCRSPCHRPAFFLSCIDRSTFDSERISPGPRRSGCDTACWDSSSSRSSAPRSRPLSDTAPKPAQYKSAFKSFPRYVVVTSIVPLSFHMENPGILLEFHNICMMYFD